MFPEYVSVAARVSSVPLRCLYHDVLGGGEKVFSALGEVGIPERLLTEFRITPQFSSVGIPLLCTAWFLGVVDWT